MSCLSHPRLTKKVLFINVSNTDLAMNVLFDMKDNKIADMESIKQVVTKAKEDDRKAMVERIKNTNFWKTCEDYFTPEQRDYFLTIII